MIESKLMRLHWAEINLHKESYSKFSIKLDKSSSNETIFYMRRELLHFLAFLCMNHSLKDIVYDRKSSITINGITWFSFSETGYFFLSNQEVFYLNEKKAGYNFHQNKSIQTETQLTTSKNKSSTSSIQTMHAFMGNWKYEKNICDNSLTNCKTTKSPRGTQVIRIIYQIKLNENIYTQLVLETWSNKTDHAYCSI